MRPVLQTARGSLRLLLATVVFSFVAALPDSLGLCRALVVTLL